MHVHRDIEVENRRLLKELRSRIPSDETITVYNVTR